MILNDAVISNLIDRIDEPESSISSHWRAELEGYQHDQGTFVGVKAQGHTTKTTLSQQLRHFALLTPFRHMGNRLPSFKDYHRAGKAIASSRGGVLDLGMMRQVLSLSLLDQYIPIKQMRSPVIIIGDGWGTMASLVLSCLPEAKLVLVNLTRMLLVDLVYIKKSFPDVGVCLARDEGEYRSALNRDDLRVIAVCADDLDVIAHGPIGIAINIASMQEMDPSVIASYFEAIRKSTNLQTYFYCCNRAAKTLPDGTVVRFEEYPWRTGDTLLLDGHCPWHQYYTRLRPPFRGRYDGPIMHRLAVMDKTNL